MQEVSLSEFFTMIAPGVSISIAFVAVSLSMAFFLLANRLFRKTEASVSEIEKSVNQMYSAITKLSRRSESPAAEFDGGVLQFQEIAEHYSQDAETLNSGVSQAEHFSQDAETLNNGVSQAEHFSQDSEGLNNGVSQAIEFGQDSEALVAAASQAEHFSQDAEEFTNGAGQAMRFGQDAELLNYATPQVIDEPTYQTFIDPQPILEKVPAGEVLHGMAGQINGDSLQARISAIVGSEDEDQDQEDEEMAW